MSLSERKKEIFRELNEMKRRIEGKNAKKIKIYCIKAPKEVVDTIIKSILDLSEKISTYNTINTSLKHFSKSESSYSNLCMSSEEIGKYIYNTVKRDVEYLKQNYYEDIVGNYRDTVESEINKIDFEEYDEVKSLLESLSIVNYIEKHNEYYKVSSLIEETILELDNIHRKNYRIDEVFEVIGCKEIFSEYERRINDIVSISDINLKRAVWTYIDCEVEFF